MTSRHVFGFCDLLVFGLLWTLMLVTVAVWLGDAPASSESRSPGPKDPDRLIRYVGEESPTQPD